MRWRDAVGIVARLLVGGVLVAAGLLKLPDPAQNVRAVRAYELLPETIVAFAGHLLPVLEVLIGLCLVLGLLTRLAATLSALMLLAFAVAIASAWARGLQIECGCFGGGVGPAANATARYPWDIARDIGLLLLSGWLVVRPTTPYAADNRLLAA